MESYNIGFRKKTYQHKLFQKLSQELDTIFNPIVVSPQPHASAASNPIEDNSAANKEEQIHLLKTQLVNARLEVGELNAEIQNLKRAMDENKNKFLTIKKMFIEAMAKPKSAPKRKKKIFRSNSSYTMDLSKIKEDATRDSLLETNKLDNLISAGHSWEHPLEVCGTHTAPGHEANMFGESRSKIYILSDDEATVGLSEELAFKLSHSRVCAKNKYSITSIVSPNSKCEYVLNHCKTLDKNLRPDDRVVIAVGGNDYNQMKLFSELSSAINKVKFCKVILLSVHQTAKLDASYLNNQLKLLANCHSNCTFIDVGESSDPCAHRVKICQVLVELIEMLDCEVDQVLRPNEPGLQ